MTHAEAATPMKVCIVDAMAEKQSLIKPDWVKDCYQLADCFTAQTFGKHGDR